MGEPSLTMKNLELDKRCDQHSVEIKVYLSVCLW